MQNEGVRIINRTRSWRKKKKSERGIGGKRGDGVGRGAADINKRRKYVIFSKSSRLTAVTILAHRERDIFNRPESVCNS